MSLSSYVTGCCDNQIYKIKSGTKYTVGNLLISKPINFCYTVIEEPDVKVYFTILNDDIPLFDAGSGLTCSYSGCLPCPGLEPTPMPPPPIPGVSYNECEPITLFPLGAECIPINPNINSPNSGILSLAITGGTAPYYVVWSLPNNTTATGITIYNLSAGTYTATVTDKYYDYTTTVSCSLIEPIDCTFSGSVSELNYLLLGSGSTILSACSGDTNEYWSTVSQIFEMKSGDILYYDYELTQPVTDGYYSNGIYWLKTNLLGEVLNIGTCSIPTITPSPTPTSTPTPTVSPTPTSTPTPTPTPTP